MLGNLIRSNIYYSIFCKKKVFKYCEKKEKNVLNNLKLYNLRPHRP